MPARRSAGSRRSLLHGARFFSVAFSSLHPHSCGSYGSCGSRTLAAKRRTQRYFESNRRCVSQTQTHVYIGCSPFLDRYQRRYYSGASGGSAGEDGGTGPGEGGDSRGNEARTNLGGKRTFYDILEVNRRVKQDEIKNAYRKLAKRYHPDHNADDPDAEQRFKEVQEAYTTLSEPFKRALYDQDLQFSTYGSKATQEVDREMWTEHWDKESPEERQSRRERYKRYAAGERNDQPPAPFKLSFAPLYMLSGFAVMSYVCINAPDWFDGQSDPTYCDPATNDTSVPLVQAFHDPIMNRWERLAEGQNAPLPQELYDYYRHARPDIMERVDTKVLPKVRLTTTVVPRTESVRAILRDLKPAVQLAVA